MTLPAPSERQKILTLLDRIAPALDDLLLAGLASASDSTRQILGRSFQSASQMRLLRLGSTLRVAAEEIGRYAANDPLFSRRRYSFFVNRAWMLCRGMRRALENQDDKHWTDLTWQPGGEPVESALVVTLGVSKRVVPGAFCAYEFRLRGIDKDGPCAFGAPLIWSTVFPMKKGVDVPAEAYLRLPQKQKFKAAEFLERRIMRIEHFRLAAGGRIQMDEDTVVEQQGKFKQWSQFAAWDLNSALRRVQEHETNPFELDIELQEEVVLDQWRIGENKEDEREARYEITIHSGRVALQVGINKDEDGESVRNRLNQWGRKTSPPPLFGIMHYEHGNLMIHPLSVLHDSGPTSLSLDDKEIDYRSLMKALDL